MKVFRLVLGRWVGAQIASLACLPILFLIPSLAGADVLPMRRPPGDAHPRRLIVKYRESCVGCGTGAAGVTRAAAASASLARLDAEYEVKSRRPLLAAPSGGVASSQRLASARARFPERAKREPRQHDSGDLSGVYVLEFVQDTDVEAAAARFAADPAVEYAQPDYLHHLNFIPDDPYFSRSGSWHQPFADLWGLHNTQAEGAWDVATGAGVVVAVVDTGVKYKNRELKPNLWINPGEIPNNRKDDDGNGFVDDVNGWDFVDGDKRPLDQNGHGTHVAGTIAATGNDARGIIGMAWNARIMPVRGLDKRGNGYDSDLAAGIVYAAENGADVISNSWGSDWPSRVIADAVSFAYNLGVVVIFAAGNSSSQYLGEAGLPEVIAVAATDYQDQVTYFTNFGDEISVAAPGLDVLSLNGGASVRGLRVGRYRVLSGTSMSTPHVSGVAALLLQAMPTLTPDEIRWHIELNADQQEYPPEVAQNYYPGYEGQRWNPFFGYGRVNAARVFDTPSVTSRLRPRRFAFHDFAGAATPNILSLDASFTTLASVNWSFEASSWLSSPTTIGSGRSTIPIDLVATNQAPGVYSGTVGVQAPDAVDGGAAIPVTADLHGDHRVGNEMEVVASGSIDFRPEIAADPNGSIAVWIDNARGPGLDLVAARLDASGAVSAPVVIDGGNGAKTECALAFDGTNYLVVWVESSMTQDTGAWPYIKMLSVRGRRVSTNLQLLDAAPIEIWTRSNRSPTPSNSASIKSLSAAFNGATYLTAWREDGFDAAIPRAIRIRRIGALGGLWWPARLLLPAGTEEERGFAPRLACRTDGTCLLIWLETITVGGVVPAVSAAYGFLLQGDEPQGARKLLVDNLRGTNVLRSYLQMASSESGYLIVGLRDICPPYYCGYDLVGGRVAGDGTPLDPAGFRLNEDGYPYFFPSPTPTGLSFDGTSYLVLFTDLQLFNVPEPVFPLEYGRRYGLPLFLSRVATDGTVSNDGERYGLLVRGKTTTFSGVIASNAQNSIVSWLDTRSSKPGEEMSIYAQRMLAH